jgi:hypothetical protein
MMIELVVWKRMFRLRRCPFVSPSSFSCGGNPQVCRTRLFESKRHRFGVARSISSLARSSSFSPKVCKLKVARYTRPETSPESGGGDVVRKTLTRGWHAALHPRQDATRLFQIAFSVQQIRITVKERMCTRKAPRSLGLSDTYP